MKNTFKKMATLLLALVLCFSSFSAFTVNAGSDVKKGEFVFAPHTYMDGDLVDIYYYSDSVFEGPATEYNEHLATMSMILAASSISSQDPDATYEVKSRNLKALLEDWDFTDFEVNEYYTQRPGEQTMGVGMAHKVIGEGDEAYTLLAIVPRSAGYQREWAGNFTVGKEGLHEGFTTGRDIILDFAKDYVEAHADDFEDTVKVWTVGYSRGAGVANLLGAYLDDNPDTLGIELEKDNVFAYTFGTPSNVQYEDDVEKARLESDYLNIHNRYSEYDIVTYAPLKTWNFTYYGTTKLFDVYNAEKKAEMLKFLEKTNKLIYDIYTAENSSADPDNFAPVMVELSEGFSINIVPADESYGIPTTQKEFLDSRVEFLTENLVADRETYVECGYQYALQCLTSLYFGLDAEQGSLLLGGMSHNVMFLAASYYCYYVADHYLNLGSELSVLLNLELSLDYIEQYVKGLSEIEGIGTSSWYLYAVGFFEGEKYLQLRQTIDRVISGVETLATKLDSIRMTLKDLAVGMTSTTLGSGVMALEIDENEKLELYDKMTSDDVTIPLTDFFICLLLGTYDDSIDAFDPSNKNVATAVTFIMNAGRYMRVHNNEIILSWLRTEDSYYENENKHVHKYTERYGANGHWTQCSCGSKTAVKAHTFGEWEDYPEGEGLKLVRYCECGYEQIHTHEFKLAYGETGHYNECECGYKEAESAHTFGEWTENENGTLVRSCECGYTEEHSHKLEKKQDETSHWEECACGYKTQESAHTFGEWTDNGDGTLVCSCECGYEQKKPAPAAPEKPADENENESEKPSNNTLVIVCIASAVILVLIVIVAVILKKRKTK